MNRRTKYLALAGMISFAAYGNAGSAVVTPALAACSKALVATLVTGDTLPAYTVKAPSPFVSTIIDPHAYTVIATNTRTKELLGKAQCKATPKGEIVSFKALPLKS